ncbi:MAG: hypothetical protein QOD99_3167 [Chthoniobacter sp.]|jgi:uncharacterized protein YecE (DUF72 family)|nr:hypothetical protein [Chthoniobacter sp.]
MSAKILIGTASWSDPEFVRDWYPRGLPASERLRFYAQQFDMVELNSSFYGIPQRRQVEQWIPVTPPGFVFNVKLHKLLSRHSCEKKMLPVDLQKAARTTPNDRVILTPEIETATSEKFLEAVEPFENAGKLGVLLLQLSPGFSPRKNQLAELDSLLNGLAPRSVAVELRNRNWVEDDRIEQTVDFFRGHHATLVSVDAPRSENFNVMPAVDLVTNPSEAYLRLHGMNEQGYLKGKSVAERFDYDYSDDELAGLNERVGDLAREAQRVHVVFNNNRSDFAPKNATRFREMMAERSLKSGLQG